MEPKAKRNQILVPVPMTPKFIEELGAALKKLGYSNRADFIREAILEKLEAEGEYISPSIAAAPSRTGKGGRKSSSGAGAQAADDHIRYIATDIRKARKAGGESK